MPKTVLNLIEREMAPSIVVCVFLISVGAFYAFSAVLMVFLLCASGYLFWAYKNQKMSHIVIGRILLFSITIILFIVLLSDDHVFEDSTLPQLVEMHMTYAARHRHGDQTISNNHTVI